MQLLRPPIPDIPFVLLRADAVVQLCVLDIGDLPNDVEQPLVHLHVVVPVVIEFPADQVDKTVSSHITKGGVGGALLVGSRPFPVHALDALSGVGTK
jgi:hypothetical protein